MGVGFFVVVDADDVPARVARMRSTLGEDPADWQRAAAELGFGPDALDVINELHDLWIVHDAANALLTGEFEPVPDDDITADRRLSGIVRQFPEGLTDWVEIEHFGAREGRDIRRWAWVQGWILLSQDEDLVAGHDTNILPLLAEAALNCPKASYIAAIVSHHVRDAAHFALFAGEGKFQEYVRGLQAWRAAAESASASDLVAYLSRLESYGETRGAQSRENVEQMVFDLRRCHPDLTRAAEIERDGARWIAAVAPGELQVDAHTGRVSGHRR